MKKLIILFIFLIVCSFLCTNNVLAIGQMTKPIIIKEAVKGEIYEDILMLVNPQDQQVKVDLATEGDIKGWASFYSLESKKDPITNFTFTSKGSINLLVRFLVPQDIPNGTYRGEVSVITVPEDSKDDNKTKASVRQKISRSVEITVTGKEIKKLEASIIPRKVKITKGNALIINTYLNNVGNITLRPSIQQKITKQGKEIINIIHPYPEGEQGVRPNSSEKIPITWQTNNIQPGIYEIEITVLIDHAIVKQSSFTIQVSSHVAQFLASIKINQPKTLGLALIGVGFLLMGVFLIRTFIFKKRDWMIVTNFVKGIFT